MIEQYYLVHEEMTISMELFAELEILSLLVANYGKDPQHRIEMLLDVEEAISRVGEVVRYSY